MNREGERMREREISTRSPGGFSAQKAQKTSQAPRLAVSHERKETHMVGLLDLLNQEKAERAAERRAQFMQQQQRGGQGTAPSSNAGSVRAPESSSLDELRKRQAGIPTTAQRGPESSSMTELLGRQQVPFFPTPSDSVPESRRRVERRSARALAPSA